MNVHGLQKKLPALASILFTGLRMVSTVIWMVCTLVILILQDPAPAFRQLLIEQATEQTHAWTGLPLSINRISELRITPARQVIQLDHLRLMEAPNSRNRFLEIPQLRLELNLLAYLLQKPALNRLQIHAPHFFVRRDLRGQFNFKPQLKKMKPKPEEPAGKQPYVPQIEIKIDETLIHYRDQNPHHPLTTRLRLPMLAAELKDQNYLKASGHLRSLLSDLDLSARLHLWSGQTTLQAQLRNPNLAPAAAYAARIKDFKLLSGTLNSGLEASWQDYHLKNLRYRGQLAVENLSAHLPLYRLPWQLSSRLRFNQTQMEIDYLHLNSPAHDITLAGTLYNFQTPTRMRVATTLNLNRINLAEISSALQHPVANTLRGLNPSGTLKAHLRLHGSPTRLHINGSATLPEGNIRNIALKNLQTQFSYRDQQLDIPLLSGHVFSGALQARARLNLNAGGTIAARTEVTSVSLHDLKQTFNLKLPTDYNPEGKISLSGQLSGPLKAPRASGWLTSARLSFPGSAKISVLQDMRLKFEHSPTQTQAHLQTHSAEIGTLNMALLLKNSQQLEVQLHGHGMPVQTVNHWLPGNWLQSGNADIQARVSGSLPEIRKNPQHFKAHMQLAARELELNYPARPRAIQQHLNQLQADLNWADGHAYLNTLVLKAGQSRLTGSGSAALQKLAGQDWSQALQAELHGQLSATDFPLLSRYELQKGESNIDLTLRGKPKRDLEVTLHSEGKNFEIQQVHLDHWGLHAQFSNRQLELRKAHLQQGDDRLALSGTADFRSADPRVNLKAHSDRFQLENLLTLLPPDLKAQLENKAKNTALPPADREPPLYTLPQVRERMLFRPDSTLTNTSLQASDLAIPLGELMENHWKKWSYPPETSAPPSARPETQEKQNLLETLKGQLAVDLQLTGSLKKPEITAKTLLRDLQIQDSHISEAWLEARYADRNLHISPSWIQEQSGSLLRAEGDIHLDREMQVELQGEGINLKAAAPFLKNQTRLEGNLDFFAVATGSLRQPEVSAQLNIKDLLMNQLFFDRLETLSGYRNGYLEDLRTELNYGDQQVVVFGNFPVSDRNKPMDLTLSLEDDSFGLINLFTGTLDWRQGKGAVLVRLVGTPRKPELEGTFRLDKATVYLPALKELMSDIDIKGQVFTKTVQLDYLKGKLAGGNLEVKGSMDLLNLLPSFLNLDARGENLSIRYTMPGLLNTQTTVKEAALKIKGLITQPVITGKVTLGKNGETTFPFLKERNDFPTSSEVTDESGKVKPPRFLFGGLNVEIPFEYGLHSPIFDIPVYSEKGVNLKHRGGRMTITGDILAKKGTLYLFNNALNIDRLSVNFPKLQSLVGQEQGLNPDLRIETSFNVKGADQSVKALITGKLEDLKSNQMRFEFSNKQGLTDTQILNQILGGEAVVGLSQGDIAGVAAKFSDVFLRGLFNPLTSRLSELLGLEELSLGIVGQSVSGPVFSFNIRSNPFFLVEDLIEERLQQLSFLNRLRISGQGTLSEQAIYKLGGNYSINENWALDYQFKSNEQLHNLTIKGSYPLPAVLDWLRSWRARFQGELKDPFKR